MSRGERNRISSQRVIYVVTRGEINRISNSSQSWHRNDQENVTQVIDFIQSRHKCFLMKSHKFDSFLDNQASKKENMESIINVAVLGTGMMGQEHISYMKGYPQIKLKFICDSCSESIEKALSLLPPQERPECFRQESEMLKKVDDIDLLVISTPNYMRKKK